MRRGDEGQVGLLVLACSVVAAALVLVAGAATQVHLAHQQLRSLADAAALHAAEAVDEQAYYTTGTRPGQDVPVSDEQVRAAAADDLTTDLAGAVAGDRLEGVALASPSGSPDGRTAEVTLRAQVHPWLLPRRLARAAPAIDLEVTSSARAGLVAP